MSVMAKERKPKPEEKRDRSMVSLPPEVHQQLKKLAERNDRAINRELRRIVVKELQAEGLWPPEPTEE